MDLVQSMVDGVSWALFLNPSTLSGSIDVIVVRHKDNSLHCTPFHVRFGKLQLLYSSEKTVKITVNGEEVPFNMKLGAAGEAFFVHEIKKDDDENEILCTSPIIKDKSSNIIHNSSNNNEILPSKAEQILQEHPEALVGIMKLENENEEDELENSDDKNLDWTWGWGTLPRIESKEIEKYNKQLEDNEAIVTLSESKQTSTMATILNLFRRKKPQYLSSTNDSNMDDDIFFDMEDDDDDEPVKLSMDIDDESDSNTIDNDDDNIFYDTNEDDNTNESSNDLNNDSIDDKSLYTIYVPDDNDSSNDISNKSSQFASTDIDINNNKSLRDNTILPQSLPNTLFELKQQKSNITPFSSSNILNTLTKESLLNNSTIIEISVCGRKLFTSQKPLSIQDVNRIFDKHIITKDILSNNTSILSNTAELAVRINNKIFPWNLVFPSIMSALLFNSPLEINTLETLEKKELDKQDNKKAWMSWLYPSRWRRSSTAELPIFTENEINILDEDNIKEVNNNNKEVKDIENNKKQKTLQKQKLSLSNKDISTSPLRHSSAPTIDPLKKVEYKKSLRPTQEQIHLMNLKPGANSITFSVNTELRGTQTLVATVYLWEHDSKLVISDIDGTITRSDVFGHVLPMVGKDWSHSGVAKLFSSIRENGYHIVYLTSRAIGQAQTTRNFINNLKQDGDIYLPKGPVFMSPDRLFWAFNREVIRRKPEEFKIACLQDIARLFPKNPYYSGFGNRNTDLVAYQAAGVPPARVFIINPSGTITTINKTFKKTYLNLTTLVNEIYPPTQDYDKGVSEDYNDWNYWKMPIPDLPDI